MEGTRHLRELMEEVQTAVDAYIKSDDIANYKELQTRLTRLQVASSKPADTLFAFRLQMIENIAIFMLLEMGILDALVARQGETATAVELAAATGCNELVIARLMRIPCALLFCEEMDEMTYRANHITSLLVKPGWKGALQWAEALYPIMTDIRRFLSSTSFGRTSEESAPSAFEFSHGKTMWKVLEEQPDQRHNFELWMRERRKHEENLWHRRFPPCTLLSSANLKIDPEAVLMVVSAHLVKKGSRQSEAIQNALVSRKLSFRGPPSSLSLVQAGAATNSHDIERRSTTKTPFI